MNGKELKEIWHSETPSFGAFVTSTDPMVSAIVCNVGFEWLILDAEHAPFNPETLRSLLAVIRSRGTVPLIRVADNNAALIKQALDLGAEGIMVPLLQTGEDARRAVAACRYPPDGVRGFNPRDASNFFFETGEYVHTINERVVVMLQVEHYLAVENLDDILAVAGVDAIFIGPADLSYSLGHPLEITHSDVQDAIQIVIRKCNAAHIPVGILVAGTLEDYASWIKRGLNFIIPYVDYVGITQSAAAALHGMRKATGGR